jgi:GT2 family glycosyltransferase/glycosyltransferase involved in cell wall biosynthesis
LTEAQDMAWRLRVAQRARAQKLRFAGGTAMQRRCVPAFEAVEVFFASGVRETAARTYRRLFGGTPARPTAEVFHVRQPVVIPPMVGSDGVSIVIPVRDQMALTHACLAAIAKHTPAGQYEVIVVDNASGHATRAMLERVAGIRVIRNRLNAGFVDACNDGARAAVGQFVLFLNNDTVVRPGWLDALSAAMAHDQRAGAVGAKLLYPDGRLQEAGGIIFRDGSGWNYGKGQDPEAPEYNYLREVDYCSGACLLVRRTLFETLGGFDRAYAPAYYEDADLCFRLRDHGYRVLYQPSAQVFHVEGATAGTDPGTGFKACQSRNRARLVERHSRALELQSPRGETPDLRSARDRNRGLRVLVVDHRVPQPDHDAGSVRMEAILRILIDLGCRVTFLPDDLARSEPYVAALQQRGVEVLYGPMLAAEFITCHASAFDVALLCRAPVAARYFDSLRAAAAWVPVIFDTVDLHYVRETRQATVDDSPLVASQAASTKIVELGLAKASDMVWVTSTHEEALLRQHDPATRVGVVPMIHEVRVVVPPFGKRRDLLFIGGFQHQPNEDAVIYFAGEIMPLIRLRLPGVRLVVVGSHVTERVQALAAQDIEVRGFVPDVVPVFDVSRLSVAPLRYGAGVKGKITQSLAWGVPVVTTPVGAEGMELRHGVHAMVAETPEAFAKCVHEVYTNEATWNRLSQGGREHVRTSMGYEAVRDTIKELLGSLRPAL